MARYEVTITVEAADDADDLDIQAEIALGAYILDDFEKVQTNE